MKRKSSRYRALPFPARFVRSSTDHQPDLARLASANGQGGLRSRRIFVIKQVRRPFGCRSGQALESTTGTHKKIRRILIFDDHPDSLRLVFEGDANPDGDLSVPEPVSSWELILVSILTMGALIGMFWPLF
jgi:hypothetical protein